MSSIITKNFDLKLNTNHLSNNLCYLMKKTEIDTSELSKQTGIAITTLNSLKRGNGNPTLSTLKTLSEFFNLSVGQLTENNLADCSSKSKLREVPLLEILEMQEFLEDNNKFNSTITIDIEKTSSKIFAVKISNSCLAPFFEKGTIFIVSHELQAQDGDIALIQFNNQVPCFRRIFIEGETYVFSQLSELIGKEVSKSNNFVIHGIVTKAIQNFHE